MLLTNHDSCSDDDTISDIETLVYQEKRDDFSHIKIVFCMAVIVIGVIVTVIVSSIVENKRYPKSEN